MSFGSMGLIGGGKTGPSARTAIVASTLTGTVYSISRLLGTGSSLALIAGTNANLTLSGANIQAAVALGTATQTAVVRESLGSIAIEYPVAITGQTVVTAPAAPTLGTPVPGNTQATVPWTDGSNGGSAITAHKIYRSTTAGFTPGPANLLTTISTASPFVDTGLTNGTPYYYAISAVNSIGESAPSAIQSVTPANAAVLSFDLPITLTKATGQYSAVIRRTGDTSGTTVANWSAAASVLPGRTGALVGPDFGGTWPGGIVTFNPGDVTKTVTFTPAATSNVSPE